MHSESKLPLISSSILHGSSLSLGPSEKDKPRIKIKRKLVIVGEDDSGKTSLLTRFARGEFPEMPIPKVINNCAVYIDVDDKHIALCLWDTIGEEGHYDRLRPLSYPGANIIIICYAINSPDSFDSVWERWVPEVLHFCHRLPIILVGCKKDLRTDSHMLAELEKVKKRPVSYEDGLAMAGKIGAAKDGKDTIHYLECSAKTGEGVNEIFQYAACHGVVLPVEKKHRTPGGPCVAL